jgi:hypothetical protein
MMEWKGGPTMKRILGFLCALALAGILPAQSSWPLVADVPFAFHVGDQAMPAGEYRVQRVAGQGMVWVIPSEPAPRAMSYSYGTSPRVKASEHNLLVFNKYGEGRYFLSQIIHAGDNVASELPKSVRERELVTSALISGIRPTRVVIAAKIR